ncbi:MAG: DUF378 domain-containing protein [Patescibacteria group bacterium]|nr:DUF378 domain-containing protein [Patescibacteria group bacterium]
MLKKIAWVLLVIGGLNLGLVGLGQLFGSSSWDVIHWILGSVSVIEALVYLLIGISTVILLFGGRGNGQSQMS